MATVAHGSSLPDSANKTDFYSIIDNATVTGIVNADVSPAAAIVDTKLAQITTASKVSGAALTSLASIPSGAGAIPAANVTAGTNIPDSSLASITTASKVSGAALTSLASIPSGAGVVPIVNLASGTPTGSKFLRDDGSLQLVTSKSILSALNSFTGSATTYTAPGDITGVSGTQSNHVCVMSVAGTIKNLYVVALNTNSGTIPVTVYKGASPQSLTATVGSSLTTANDTTHSFSVAAGDTISFEVVNNRLATGVAISVEFDA